MAPYRCDSTRPFIPDKQPVVLCRRHGRTWMVLQECLQECFVVMVMVVVVVAMAVVVVVVVVVCVCARAHVLVFLINSFACDGRVRSRLINSPVSVPVCHDSLHKTILQGTLWRAGDAVVGRGKAGYTSSKSGRPCPRQSCSQSAPADQKKKEREREREKKKE